MLTLDCQNSCRICLIENDNLKSIFDIHDDRKISDVLMELAGIIISEEDSLSKKICEECKLKAFELAVFRQLIIDSDETIRYNLLLNENNQQEHNDDVIEELIEEDENSIDETIIEEYHLKDDEESMNEGEHEFLDPESYEVYHLNEDDDSLSQPITSQNKVILVKEDSEDVDIKLYGQLSSSNVIAINIYDSSDDLTEKMRAAHFAKEELKKYKCQYCEKSFLFPSKVRRHVQAVHKDCTVPKAPKKVIKKNHRCPICNKAFVSNYKVKRHMVVHDTELKTGLQKNWTRNYILCQQCSRKFHTKDTYDRHTYVCEMLVKSEYIRPPDHNYLCAVCLNAFKQHDDMVEHMKNVHKLEGSSSIKCQLCEDFYGNIAEIIKHGRNHQENVTYRCQECFKFFPNGDEIIFHLLRHVNYKPYECTHEGCGKRFFDRYKLKIHMSSHDPNAKKKFNCTQCDQQFAHLDYLNCHVRRKHSKVKPYSCQYCSKSFAFNHDLNLHLTNHTGNKKHVCVICNSSFTKSWSLKQHMLLHEDTSSRLQCTLCDFSTFSKAQYNKHLSSHGNFTCDECNIDFKTENEFREHREQVHQMINSFIENDPYSMVEIRSDY